MVKYGLQVCEFTPSYVDGEMSWGVYGCNTLWEAEDVAGMLDVLSMLEEENVADQGKFFPDRAPLDGKRIGVGFIPLQGRQVEGVLHLRMAYVTAIMTHDPAFLRSVKL